MTFQARLLQQLTDFVTHRCNILVMSKVRKAANVKSKSVDPYIATLLEKITVGKKELTFRKGEKIFSQGDPADSIYFIQSGRIKVIVVSAAGKEAVLAMPGPRDFLVKSRLSSNLSG
jgi:CRP-like cAMP-binding protein